ncbi:LrgB family protein [Acinetobacter kookii]|uniref:Effector of murein hydrolase n=1 Tax=Acinetobacter kookii TaxID=1226327 RepID=A0A1G6NHW0_9GAMM|nr:MULTISPECIES: LrgB family protein [Acinetobacter]MCT8090363.1 LrgB family protein [Acinetobacter sp. F_3_1]MCT8098768.1 LrgB family protein [Acinetobacter sp. C_3_1]MCT8101987.1 LrgB family protein [Acinetobacter sp. C_4_1]MCT8135734.1 LrgB family protein [Acinetobacter sp. T_3_1]TCB72708.1 LrgB family protein [Acinetobacter sp. ANC 4216]
MFAVLSGFFITLIAYLVAKPINKRLPQIPVIVIGMFLIIGLLFLFGMPYESYMAQVNPLFNRLLGYVTVALAIPLAAMRYDDLPLKAMLGILVFASISAVALPMGLAYLLHMTDSSIMAFATRAVTTPIAINIATLLHAPISMVILIVILSGVIGAAFSPLILRHINDERASGLALGLAAHAIGTAQAWQRGSVAGRYAAFGMAVNAVFTAIWLPTFILYLQKM